MIYALLVAVWLVCGLLAIWIFSEHTPMTIADIQAFLLLGPVILITLLQVKAEYRIAIRARKSRDE